jgi:hypothetical protein
MIYNGGMATEIFGGIFMGNAVIGLGRISDPTKL